MSEVHLPTIVSESKLAEFVDTRMADAERLVAQVEAATIETDDQATAAARLLNDIKTMQEDVDNQRKDWVLPIDRWVKKANKQFKPTLDRLKNLRSRLSVRLSDYQAKKRREADAARRKAEQARAEAERKRQEADALARKPPEQESTTELDTLKARLQRQRALDASARLESEAVANLRSAPPVKAAEWSGGEVKSRKYWTYRVVNLSDVPVEYVIDRKAAIMQAIHSGTRHIPGLKIFQDERVG